jgi:hypothetical protein
MPSVRLALLAGTFLVLAAPANAHGDLTIHELETLAIRDFEGHEDSFAWEGWEIWDVYVGDGYDFLYDGHGVYFKVNFAGDGKLRPTQGKIWGIDINYKVGEEVLHREIRHDGTQITTTFENLEHSVADGNVFQIRAWAPVENWTGKFVTDIVVITTVDGQARDTAPGGIHAPGTGTEIPVRGPSTFIFPPLGEGRIVDRVALTGPEKFLNTTITDLGDGAFQFNVANPLKSQGQHVHLRLPEQSNWTIATTPFAANLDGAASLTFTVSLASNITAGVLEPVLLDLYTDIGGRQMYYAYVDNGQIRLTNDAAQAKPTTLDVAKESPGLGFGLLIAALAVAFVVRRKR